MIKTENNLELSVVLPCRNEQQALAGCINQIKAVLNKNGIGGEIIVSDSSTDRSPEIAKKLGVKLIKHDQKGYGVAYLEGFKVAQGKYIFMADADGTYSFEEIPKFLNHLKQGYDFVIGNRFDGKMEKGAMPFLHRYFGNPILSFLFRIFFQSKIYDIHCGMRAISRQTLCKLNLKTIGMEFASEMIIMAQKEKLKIKEVPINYQRRVGRSKLRSWPDGWRHLRFMLMYAPDYLFLVPGVLLFLAGLLSIVLFISSAVYGCFLVILGYQIISLGIYTKVYMKSINFIKDDVIVDYLAKIIKFESGIVLSILPLFISFLLSRKLIFDLISQTLKIPPKSLIIIALTVAILGIQTMFSAFLVSILLVEKDKNKIT